MLFLICALKHKSWVLVKTASVSNYNIAGRTSRSIGIAKGALTPGQHYTIQVQVTIPGYAASIAAVVGTVNYVPYAGTCTMDKTSGEFRLFR